MDSSSNSIYKVSHEENGKWFDENRQNEIRRGDSTKQMGGENLT